MKIYFVDDKKNGVAWIDEQKNYISTTLDNPIVQDYLKSGKTIEEHDPQNPLVIQWEKMMESN
jgi:hypothetical protein